MTFKEINQCVSGTPVMLADSKIGILIFDGRVSEDEHHAAVRILGTDRMEMQSRAVSLSLLVDLRKERGALVELDLVRSGVMRVNEARSAITNGCAECGKAYCSGEHGREQKPR